jgi:3-deoxy-7-phosphoheptulonate synthase
MKVIVMKNNASVSDIGGVIRKVEELGFKPLPLRSEDKTTIGVLGAGKIKDLPGMEAMPGVERITSIDEPYKLGNREFKPDKTIVRVNGVAIGGKSFVVMAGPCSVESFDQALSTAEAVKASGARVLRGGAFKPRTSPYSFQGLGEEGLKILLEVKKRTGLPIVTEVTSPHLVDLVGKYADILQVGARNMQNYALLEAVGGVRKPVLLKRGMMSKIEELLMAAEYILSNGNTQVILCERGIRTFETTTRNTLDISAVPVIKSRSHLPVIVDPSHATGARHLIRPMAMAAVAAGADGIIVEVHPSPADALCDGVQSLSFPEFEEMMRGVQAVAEALGRPIGGRLFPGKDPHVDDQAPRQQTTVAFTTTSGRKIRVAIIGLGQIGGSLAAALKTSDLACTIHGYDSDEKLLGEALNRKLIDFSAPDLNRALEEADMVFLAVPSREIVRLVAAATRIMRPGSILVDVGSTKRSIVLEMEKSGGKVHCIGGHPIAGTERSGPDGWNPRLFAGKSFVLVKTRSFTRRVEKRLDDVLSRIGARVFFMDADAHDEVTAITSHLPYLLGCALTSLVDKNGAVAARLTGGAFRSATRVVASSPQMRADICLTNSDKLIEAYEAFDKEVRSLLSTITGEGQELQAVLEKLRDIRERITTNDGNVDSANPVSARNTEGAGR